MATVNNDNYVEAKASRKTKNSFQTHKLRLCLKYRPEILKLILKMHQCIKRKNTILKRLKKQLKLLTSLNTQTEAKETALDKECLEEINDKTFNEVSTQTEKLADNVEQSKQESEENENASKSTEWNVNNGIEEKSIEEQVKEVAQSALQESGMVYVESAGMYYDYKTGYYYNSELGLYYHTDTGCYYYYSNEKQNFVFHSYPDRSALIDNAPLINHAMKKAKKHKKDKEDGGTEESSKPKRKKPNKKENSRKIKRIKEKVIESKDVVKLEPNIEPIEMKEEADSQMIDHKDIKKEEMSSDNDLEDGECSETDNEEETELEDEEDEVSENSTSTASDDDDDSVARQHPPCMRLIVRETNIAKLKVGSLFLVTKDGGTIGREGEQHAILIADTNVSRNHLEIKYDTEQNVYTGTDLGSKNGTILNGARMSVSQDISSPMEIAHGSVIQLGETKLLCHIHPGNDTCGHCEPGLIMESIDKERKVAYTRTCSVKKQHRLELARLRNKYATQLPAIEESAYNDRAETRRRTVGSSHDSEKTQSSDVNTFITPENKGFKLLEKMGWSKGEGLGKDSQGDREPIPLVSNEGKAGLGTHASTPIQVRLPKTSTLGPATLRLAARTKMLQPPAKAFQVPTEYDSE